MSNVMMILFMVGDSAVILSAVVLWDQRESEVQIHRGVGHQTLPTLV